jgi:hypothetical protein
MPSYIVFAREARTMRADRRNSIIVNAADAEAARAAAEVLVGPAADALADFAVLDLASVARPTRPTEPREHPNQF